MKGESKISCIMSFMRIRQWRLSIIEWTTRSRFVGMTNFKGNYATWWHPPGKSHDEEISGRLVPGPQAMDIGGVFGLVLTI